MSALPKVKSLDSGERHRVTQRFSRTHYAPAAQASMGYLPR